MATLLREWTGLSRKPIGRAGRLSGRAPVKIEAGFFANRRADVHAD